MYKMHLMVCYTKLASVYDRAYYIYTRTFRTPRQVVFTFRVLILGAHILFPVTLSCLYFWKSSFEFPSESVTHSFQYPQW